MAGLLAAAAPLAACPTANTGASCGSALSAGGGGARHIVVTPRAPRFAPGDRLPPGRYPVLLNSGYYGLPPVGDGWFYYRVEGRALRVDRQTLEVLEDVTSQTNAAF